MTSWPNRWLLRGRDAEIGVLSEQLAAARSGAGTVSVIEAGPGLGKTRLIEEAAQIARRLSVAVGCGVADKAMLAVYMAPLLEALFAGEDSVLDRSRLAALEAVPDQRYWRLLELGDMLEARAEQGPMLICLDDLQWGDLATLSAVRWLSSQTVGSPIAWIVSLRDGEAGAERLQLVDGLVAAGATRLQLGPLSRPVVADLVRTTVGASPDEALLAATDAAGGNPFLVAQLLDGFAEEKTIEVAHGRAGLRQSDLPQRVQQLTVRRLGGLSVEAGHAAAVAAVLGRRFRFEDLATMLAQPAAQTLRLVAELERADIVLPDGPEYAFRHDLMHEAVLQTLPAPSVRALERQAAGVLLAAGAVPVEIATRMARSADVGDDIAIDTLRQASRALAPSDPRMAYQLSQRALALLPEDDARAAELIKATALLMQLAGDADAAREFADRAALTLPVAEQAELALTVSTMFPVRDDVRLAANRRALSLEGVPDALRAMHTAILMFNLVSLGLLAEARAAEAEAERMVEATGSIEAAEALAMGRLTIGEADGDYEGLLRRVRGFSARSDAPEEQVTLRVFEWYEANALCGLDRLDEALAVISEGARTAHRDRQAWMSYRWELARGRFLVQEGRLADARATIEWVFQQELVDVPLAIMTDNVGLLALARVAQHSDDDQLARRCGQIAKATLDVDRGEGRRQLVLLLMLQALGRGDDAGLAEAFGLLGPLRADSVLPLLARENCDDPQVVRGALRIGALDVVEQVIEQAQARADANPEVTSLRASVAHARGLRDADADQLRSAAHALSGGPRPLALASALEDLGALSARDGGRDEAVDVLGRAFELYAGCGASWDARRVRRRLRDLGVRRRLVTGQRPDHGWAALTPTELEVARLIGAGLTNRAAAERLFVSPNTVGTHVRHVFAKLDVRSRVELARRIAADSPPQIE